MIIYLAVGLLTSLFARTGQWLGASLEKLNTGDAPTKKPLRVMDPFTAVAVLALIIFSAARYYVGTDFRMYATFYSQLNPHDLQGSLDWSPQEAGYTLLAWLVRQVTDYPFAIFWVVSTITVLASVLAIIRSTKQTGLAFLLYFFLGYYLAPFNIQRQGLSVALVFLADTYFKKSWWRYIVLNLLAIAMHASAVIPIIIMIIVRYWRPRFFVVLIISGASILFSAAVVALPQLASLIATLNPRYEDYLGDDPSGIGTYLMILIRFALIAFIFWLSDWKSPNYAVTLVALSLPFLIMGTVSVPIARLEFYFSIFIVTALPNLLSSSHRKQKWMTPALALFSIAYGLIYIYFFHDLLPYQWTIGSHFTPLP